MSLLGNLKIVEQLRPSKKDLKNDQFGPKIAKAAYYIHEQLGPGLEEAVYKECFFEELQHQNIPVRRDVIFPLQFRTKRVEQAFRADFVVGDSTIVFIIAEEKSALHNMQIRSLLKLSEKQEAFIVNFRVSDMSSGIMRAVLTKGNVNKEIKNRERLN